MKNKVSLRRLSRTSEHRMAMFRTMVTQLIHHDRIKTTLPKAKELRAIADRMVTWAKNGAPKCARCFFEVLRRTYCYLAQSKTKTSCAYADQLLLLLQAPSRTACAPSVSFATARRLTSCGRSWLLAISACSDCAYARGVQTLYFSCGVAPFEAPALLCPPSIHCVFTGSA